MRLLAFLAVLAGFLLVPAGAACACSCAPFEPRTAVGDAASVFTGTVTGLRQLPGSPLGPRPPFVVTFAVDQVYRGERQATAEVATNADSASCGYRFTRGTRYLVFASDGPMGSGLFSTDPGTRLYSSLCSGNVVLRPGSGPLRRGDEAGSPKGSERSLTKELLTVLGRPTPAGELPASSPAASVAASVAVAPAASPAVSPAAAEAGREGGQVWGPVMSGAALLAAAAAVAWLSARLTARRRRTR
ncbi:hypothetical protein [Nonomuraea recticatena]|uniref:Tissue inhibitor of metalloproteinase n=1 Tax=Nonomuraea recticatena TaxID=46178 RepID=A0ABN3R5V4_9ACTN